MIDPISANMLAASFSGLAGFTVRTERDSTRVQTTEKSTSSNNSFNKNLDQSKNSQKNNKNTDATGLSLSPEEKEVIRKLQSRDSEVRTHEQAHIAAAGGLAQGGANYSYTQGPDGKQYATGGSVSIDTSSDSNNPEEMKAKARQIQAAALAPANPSSQDMSVAASASKMLSEAETKKSEEQREKLSKENNKSKSLGESSENSENSESSADLGLETSTPETNKSEASSNLALIQGKNNSEQNQQANKTSPALASQALVRQYGVKETSSDLVSSGYPIFGQALQFSGQDQGKIALVSNLALSKNNTAIQAYSKHSNFFNNYSSLKPLTSSINIAV